MTTPPPPPPPDYGALGRGIRWALLGSAVIVALLILLVPPAAAVFGDLVGSSP